MTLQFWTPDQLENTLGRLVDKTENFLTYRDVPLPPALKIDAYQTALQELRDDIKALYLELGGSDRWPQS